MTGKQYYQSLEKESVACDLCGSPRHQLLYTDDRYHMGLRTVWCTECGLVFQNPRPTEAEMGRFYREAYRRFYDSVEYPSLEYIRSGSYVQRAEAAIEMLNPWYQDSLEKRMLDIGCAEGSFLKTASQRFPMTLRQGVEPDAKFAGFAREFSDSNVFVGSWKEFAKQSTERFDLIVSIHVLEHCHSPSAWLSGVKERLSTGGVAYIEVPNVGDWCGLPQIHLAHLYLFYPETFLRLLALVGLEILEFRDRGLPSTCPSMAAVVRKGKVTIADVSVSDIRARISTLLSSLPLPAPEQ